MKSLSYYDDIKKKMQEEEQKKKRTAQPVGFGSSTAAPKTQKPAIGYNAGGMSVPADLGLKTPSLSAGTTPTAKQYGALAEGESTLSAKQPSLWDRLTSGAKTIGRDIFAGVTGFGKGIGADVVSRAAGSVLGLPKEAGHETETPAQENERLTQGYLKSKLGLPAQQELPSGIQTSLGLGKRAGGMAQMVGLSALPGGAVTGGALSGALGAYGEGGGINDMYAEAGRGALFGVAGGAASKLAGIGLAKTALPAVAKGAIEQGAFGLGGTAATYPTYGEGQKPGLSDLAVNVGVPALFGALGGMGRGRISEHLEPIANVAEKYKGVTEEKLPITHRELKQTIADFEMLQKEGYKLDESVVNKAKAKLESFDKVKAELEKRIKTTETFTDVADDPKYVNNEPIELMPTAKAKTIREQYIGNLNEQKLEGIKLAERLEKLAPKEQEALTFYNEAMGDASILKRWLDDSSQQLSPYKKYIEQALNLSPEAQKAADMMQQYYKEVGAQSLDLGTIKAVRENYNNRRYMPDEGLAKTEINKKGLSTATQHAKKRVYGTTHEAITDGMVPETLKANELLSIHSEEMAKVNTNAKLIKSLRENGLGDYTKASVAPKGYKIIEGLSRETPITTPEGEPAIMRRNFIMPEELADGLKAITDKLTPVGKLGKAYDKTSSFMKTIDLSLSLFHDLTMVMQAAYQGNLNNVLKKFDINSEGFHEMEKDFVKHTGITSRLETNADIVRNLRDAGGKLADLPIIKQIAALNDKHSEFLFGKMQRWLKVMDYQKKVAKFAGKNFELSEAELITGKKQIAQEVNAAYGGLNWEALGITPNALKALRRTLLAPDWTLSNAFLVAKVAQRGPGGQAARNHFIKAALGGLMATEALSKMLTGHFTNENKPGHLLEIEIAPNVYFSLFRGSIGDTLKLADNIYHYGWEGPAKTIQAKANPLLKIVQSVLANRASTGQTIWDDNKSMEENLKNTGKFLGQASPLPISATSAGRYLGEEEEKTPLGTAMTATGLGTYSAPQASKAGQSWIDYILSTPEEKEIAASVKASAEQKKLDTKARAEINAAYETGQESSVPKIAKKYKVSDAMAQKITNDARLKTAKEKVSEAFVAGDIAEAKRVVAKYKVPYKTSAVWFKALRGQEGLPASNEEGEEETP